MVNSRGGGEYQRGLCFLFILLSTLGDPKHFWISLTPKSNIKLVFVKMMYNQTVLTFQKGPPSEGPKLKKDSSATTNIHSLLHPLYFSLPVSGQSNGWHICCLLMHTADKLSLSDHSPAAVWFVKDSTRQDESAAQIEKGHRGYRQTSPKRCIWRKLYIWGLTGRRSADELLLWVSACTCE